MAKTQICECGIVFSHKAALSRHHRTCAVGIKIRSMDRNYDRKALHICSTCMKSFSRRDNFVGHYTTCKKKEKKNPFKVCWYL